MAARDAKTTSLTPSPEEVVGGTQPFIHPSVAASPEALAYQIGVKARLAQRATAGGVKKYTEARPGPGPAMPPLEAQHHEGMTIEQQAGMYGPRADEMVAQAPQGSIIEGAPRAPSPQPAGQLGLQMTDALPPEVVEDPAFQPGHGSMMAVNQPHLAAKYGVIRGNQRLSPQALAQGGRAPGRRSLQDTIRDMQAVAQAAPPPPEGMPKDDREAVAQAARSSAGASQNVGRPPGEAESEDARVKKAIAQLDDFDYDELRQALNKDDLNNPEQRSIIEERLEPLSLEELILKDRVQQRVPIIPPTEKTKGLVVTFESMTGVDDLALKRLLMQESKSVEVTDRYLLDKFALMTLAAGVVAINGNPIPYRCINQEGDFDEKQFWLKFEWLLKRGIHVLAAMGANHTWFEMRVRKLMVAERVKNG
jgi:hypothetical protein